MGCSTPGSTHYAGCACHEEHRQAQVARLTREGDEAREACRLIDLKIGHFGSAPEPPQDMPMLWLLWYAGRTARAALAGVGE